MEILAFHKASLCHRLYPKFLLFLEIQAFLNAKMDKLGMAYLANLLQKYVIATLGIIGMELVVFRYKVPNYVPKINFGMVENVCLETQAVGVRVKLKGLLQNGDSLINL